MTTETTKDELTARDFRTALEIQDACNLSAVVFEFARIMERLCNSTPLGSGINRNTHPICVLFANKIESLANPSGGFDAFSKAYATAKEQSKQ